jgi:hypothetical protein
VDPVPGIRFRPTKSRTWNRLWRSFVDEQVLRYLDCGVFENGVARIRCPDCAEERLLAFSCKTRELCPSCAAKRSAAMAVLLPEDVLEKVGHASWVFVIPKMLRPQPTLAARRGLGPSARRTFGSKHVSQLPAPTGAPRRVGPGGVGDGARADVRCGLRRGDAAGNGHRRPDRRGSCELASSRARIGVARGLVAMRRRQIHLPGRQNDEVSRTGCLAPTLFAANEVSCLASPLSHGDA